MALGVGRRGAHVLINGRETVSGYPMNGWGDQWTQSPGNLAFPNPLNFSEGVNPASIMSIAALIFSREAIQFGISFFVSGLLSLSQKKSATER